MLLLTLSKGGWYWCCYLLLARVVGIGVVLCVVVGGLVVGGGVVGQAFMLQD